MITVAFDIPLPKGNFTGTVTGETYESIVKEAQKLAAPIARKQIGGIKGSLAATWIKNAKPLQFCQRVVKEYRSGGGDKSDHIPESCVEFVTVFCKRHGYAKIISE